MLNYRRCFEYVPLLLVTLLIVAEAELDHQAINISAQIIIMLVTATAFFLIIWSTSCQRWIAAAIAAIVWMSLVYIKQNYILVT